MTKQKQNMSGRNLNKMMREEAEQILIKRAKTIAKLESLSPREKLFLLNRIEKQAFNLG